MGEGLGQSGQAAEYLTEDLTGPQFEEAMFGLLTGEFSTITVNGHRLVGVSSRGLNRENDIVTLGCRDESGQRHVFTYTLDPDSTVSHQLLADEPSDLR